MRKYDIVRCKINVNFHYVTFLYLSVEKEVKERAQLLEQRFAAKK